MSQQHNHTTYNGNPAENYERYFVPYIGAPLAKDLVQSAALRPGERVLDAACGTGVVARLAAQEIGPTGSVAGLDIHPGMLAVARSTTPPDMEFDWREGSVEAMPYPDASFDAVLCQIGIQFVSDKKAALNEMRRVLRPGGRLTLNVPGPIPQLFAILGEALARHVSVKAAGFVHQVFSLHDKAELQSLVDEAGFRETSIQTYTRSLRLPAPVDFLWQYVYSTPLAGVVRQVDDEVLDSVEHEVVPKWHDFVEDGDLMLQVRMVVATTQK